MAEFQDQDESIRLPESKIFEAEGDIWDYDRAARTLNLIGRAFLDRFYPTSYTEDEKSKLVREFTRSISEDHPIDPSNTPSLPGHYLRGDFPVVLRFKETYFPKGMDANYLSYDPDGKIVPEVTGQLSVENSCDIDIYSRPGMSEELRKLQSKFPESAKKFRQDVADFAGEMSTLINGISLPPYEDPVDSLWDRSLSELKEKYPFDVPKHRTLELDPKLFKKDRGKVRVAVLPVDALGEE